MDKHDDSLVASISTARSGGGSTGICTVFLMPPRDIARLPWSVAASLMTTLSRERWSQLWRNASGHVGRRMYRRPALSENCRLWILADYGNSPAQWTMPSPALVRKASLSWSVARVATARAHNCACGRYFPLRGLNAPGVPQILLPTTVMMDSQWN